MLNEKEYFERDDRLNKQRAKLYKDFASNLGTIVEEYINKAVEESNNVEEVRDAVNHIGNFQMDGLDPQVKNILHGYAKHRLEKRISKMSIK
ncbi:hypothetical protein [Staphylococcus arlettae]|uniref:hypothetical protein n=1 Tax=Staphylococcus arlettae TaxID=29378 RepID=UPI0021CF659E|nr:hypothetical protein [Staphylococcus arlettae]UXU51819.1 hypothetical protein MUA71_09730 [Staphylococcus arlettae]